MHPNDIVSLTEACKMLSVSEATGCNWVRLGKLVPNEDGENFDRKYILKVISSLQTDKNSALKKRRNKKHAKGHAVYDKYVPNKGNMVVIHSISAFTDTFSEKQIKLVIVNYALQLLLQKSGIINHSNNLLNAYKNDELSLGLYESLVEDIITRQSISENDIKRVSKMLNYKVNYYSNEDILGALYLSLRDMADRKSSGSYYTPYETVQTTLSLLSEQTTFAEKKILDPCCGTGNFLINLNKEVTNPECLYGWDFDELSIKICRINIALSFSIKNIEFLYENFICVDSLKHVSKERYDVVLGNPPWGLDFTDYDTASLASNYNTFTQRGVESYDLFVEKAISVLNENGILAFILPEAILNVRAHEPIRKIIIETCSFKFISYIGDPFHRVHCPSIIIGLILDNLGDTKGCKIVKKDDEFIISENRPICSEVISLDVSDEHWKCINSIERNDDKSILKLFLKNNAKFALGIVTGDNKNYVFEEEREGAEIIIRGNDLKKYNISSSKSFIDFKPNRFQQVAPAELYRAQEKLLYRYICDTPVFAYDDKQRLSLNSCNILIPCIKGMDMKYVLAILNSRTMAYYFRMKYNSVKVLRSHIENFPIPDADKSMQKRIIKYVNQILAANDSVQNIHGKLEDIIMDLYGLTEEERILITNESKAKNEFLF